MRLHHLQRREIKDETKRKALMEILNFWRSGSSDVCWAPKEFGKGLLASNPARVLPPSPQTPVLPCARLTSPGSPLPQPVFPVSLAGSSWQEDVHDQSRKPTYTPVNQTAKGLCPPCPSSPGVFPDNSILKFEVYYLWLPSWHYCKKILM